MHNQQGPTAECRELCSVLCGSLDGRGVWGTMDTLLCMTLCCTPKATTTVLISYTPTQNKMLKKKTKLYLHDFYKISCPVASPCDGLCPILFPEKSLFSYKPSIAQTWQLTSSQTHNQAPLHTKRHMMGTGQGQDFSLRSCWAGGIFSAYY